MDSSCWIQVVVQDVPDETGRFHLKRFVKLDLARLKDSSWTDFLDALSNAIGHRIWRIYLCNNGTKLISPRELAQVIEADINRPRGAIDQMRSFFRRTNPSQRVLASASEALILSPATGDVGADRSPVVGTRFQAAETAGFRQLFSLTGEQPFLPSPAPGSPARTSSGHIIAPPPPSP